MYNLNDYEDVDSRIHKFYETYPDGAIRTELILNDEDKNVVLFKATAWRTHLDPTESAVGYARGSRKDRGVDKDFWFENCETSAIGRCLANLGLSAKGKRASSLEMAKVNDAKTETAPIRVRTEEHKEFIKSQNAAAEVVWDTTIEPPAEYVPAFDDAVDLVTEQLKAEPIPQCKHGNMELKEGNKNGKPYRGWLCSLPYKMKAQQCAPIWMVVDANGRFTYRDEDIARVTA